VKSSLNLEEARLSENCLGKRVTCNDILAWVRISSLKRELSREWIIFSVILAQVRIDSLGQEEFSS